MKHFYFFIVFLFLGCLFFSCGSEPKSKNDAFQWDTVTIDINGDFAEEYGKINPFIDYKLVVDFVHNTKEVQIEGYYAADGQAAETSADTGRIWRAKFNPDEIGYWTYEARLYKGEGIVYEDQADLAESNLITTKSGDFQVGKGQFSNVDFRSHGKLTYDEQSHFPFFRGSGEYFVKGGANSPENFLAFQDFDGTYAIDSTKDFTKSWSPHLQDWSSKDPSWQGNKGKGIIGAINYLASQGMNSIYFLTLNIEGDGKDVWMYRNPEDFTRFDCSKLDQWDIVFTHMQTKGILLHIVTQETENELLLDSGDTGPMRQLYYRELIARFSHHNGVIWNMGEENGTASFTPLAQSDLQREAMFDYFERHDPYQNIVLLHSHASVADKDTILNPLLGNHLLDGISGQVNNPNHVFAEITKWKALSLEQNRPWLFYMDEIGPYWQGAKPDAFDASHDTLRSKVLYPTFFGGGAGVEWYFGYNYPEFDLDCENWRSREELWKQTKFAMNIVSDYFPLAENYKAIKDSITSVMTVNNGDSLYVVYLDTLVDQLVIDVDTEKARYELKIFEPQTGKMIDQSTVTAAGKLITRLPESIEKDALVIIEKTK